MKSVTVFTNDPRRPSMRLKITGNVEEYAVIEPQRVRLIGPVGKPLESKITIVPKDRYPFTVTGIRMRSGRYVSAELREKAGGGYEVTVVNRRTTTGIYYDTVILTTDSAIRQELMISVFGKII
ncbi:MAG: hypothetical protein JW736_04605 [Deltaproteobacteria bacterium]|nr:hypothetical protein [Deltaproteobacteria bacterium]